MNRVPKTTLQSAVAIENFKDYLNRKLKENNETKRHLALSVDLDRKTIIDYSLGRRIPKLDTLAKIFHHFGDERSQSH